MRILAGSFKFPPVGFVFLLSCALVTPNVASAEFITYSISNAAIQEIDITVTNDDDPSALTLFIVQLEDGLFDPTTTPAGWRFKTFCFCDQENWDSQWNAPFFIDPSVNQIN